MINISFIWIDLNIICSCEESLGDIEKIQLWHDNSDSSGWYVCEVNVEDLKDMTSYAYPCYKWLSVTSPIPKVETEITLESTTFLQVFKFF